MQPLAVRHDGLLKLEILKYHQNAMKAGPQPHTFGILAHFHAFLLDFPVITQVLSTDCDRRELITLIVLCSTIAT